MLFRSSLVCLQEHPQARLALTQGLQANRGDSVAQQALLDLAIDEFLRFESSNQLGNRRAVQASEVGGMRLPVGALVTLCIGAANRDPAQFDQPEELRLNRADNRHLAFGLGIHQCAGLSLAKLEGRIAIGRFLQRFPNYQLNASPTRGGRARFRGFLKAPFTTSEA